MLGTFIPALLLSFVAYFSDFKAQKVVQGFLYGSKKDPSGSFYIISYLPLGR